LAREIWTIKQVSSQIADEVFLRLFVQSFGKQGAGATTNFLGPPSLSKL
jgi:hypothetical protein